jgi:hypothetical protein
MSTLSPYRIVSAVVLYILASIAFQANAQTFNMSNALGTVTNACGGIFYDSNGPSTNYGNNEASIATFCAPPGQYISFEFTQFDTEDFWDELIIYNGPTTAAPIIGFYSGTNSPGTITSSLGGCITFDFASDGGIRRPGWTANITCSSTPPSTGNFCDGANPFCTGTLYNFPNNTGVPDLGTINCLFSSPNPVWYYFQIQNPGNLTIDIAQEDQFGFGVDVDFNLWGPFNSLPEGCSQISAGTAPNVDCSFSPAPSEQAVISNAQSGEFYILLLTNYSDTPGFISFTNGPGSTASTNCAILCSITDVTATPTACNPATNTFDLNGQVSVFNPPATGTLTLTSSCGGSTVINAPFPAVVNYSIAGIVPTGSTCNVTASFSDDPTCSFTQSFTSPNSCVSNTLNCPQYANVSSSPLVACGGQVYYLEVANTGCNGTISFNVVGNWGSSWADEISWNVVSNQTGAIVASGVGNIGLNGQNFNVSVGPLNPAVTGTIFTFNLFDSFGDGFNGTGGTISVQQPLGTSIVGPITGNFGTGNTTQFGANISISPATITINTPTGPIVSSVNNCKNFKIPLTLQNTNYCNTVNVSLPWTIVCQSTGAVISSGTQNVTVYPAIPQNLSDVVDIDYNETTCDWSITPLAGCSMASIGTIFNIAPNPLTLDPSGSCSGGIENFELQYIGLPSSPNCCSTGGPLQPISYVQTFAGSSVIQSTSPFWTNSNHAALITIPPNNAGGNATSLNLSISVNNYCFEPPSTNTATDYWITIIVDGQIVYDQVTINPAPINNTIAINLANIAAGYDETSTIQVYVYPNAFQAGGTNTVFNPNLTCPIVPDGRWRADISASIDVSFAEQGPTAASCIYQAAIPYQCCNPVTVANGAVTICKNGNIAAALSAWANAVDVANDNCIVFSSVVPVAGSVVPDNLIPNSTITGNQSLGAYYYCDTDNNGSVNVGDTYTLISTFTATVVAPAVAGTSSTTTVCTSGSPVNLFSILGGSPASNGTWTGPSVLSGGNLGTFNPATNSAGTYTYTVPGISPCPNAVATVTVTISSNPSATLSYTGSPFCTNTPGNISPSITGSGGGTFSSMPSGLSINAATGVITPNTSIAGTYTVTYSIAASGGCTSFNTNTTVVINPVPDVSTPLGAYSICSGPTLATASSFTINLNSSFAGTSYSWSGSDGSSGISSPISYPVPNNTCTDQTITYTITPSLNGCLGVPINRVLTIRPKPTSNFTVTPNPVCANQTATVTYSGVSCPGSTFNWIWPAGVNIVSGSGQGPYIIGFTGVGPFTIRLQVVGPSSLGSCTATQVNQVVTISPPPNAGTGATITVCASDAPINLFSLLGGSPENTGTWSGPSTLGGGNLGTFTPGSSLSGTYSYTVAGTSPCANATATVNITVTPINTSGIPTSNPTLCINTAISPSITIATTGANGIGAATGLPAGVTANWASNTITLNGTPTTSGTFNYTIPLTGGCGTVNATGTITVNPTAIAGTGTTLNLCSTSTPINLFNSLGGTPQTTGVWSGPSALGNGYWGTFDPANHTAGTYTYSISGLSPCPNVTATILINLAANPSASFLYAGAPFCTNQGGIFSPSLTGTAGGNYTSSPAGLSITPSGSITPSSSLPGTYTITYSIPASGACPAFATQNTVVITATPATPSLLPNPICAGTNITLTGSNASWYEFSINGIQVQAPSTDNTYIAPTLSAGDQVCVIAHPAIPFVFNGNINEPQWSAALSTSQGGPISGFGNNTIDALYLKNQSGFLFGAVAGRLEDNANNNKILVFLDTKSGGFNNLASWTNRNGIYYSIRNLDGGITFDAGFEPDYILGMNYAGATAFFDLYDMQAGSNNFLGTNLSSTQLGYLSNSGSGDYTKGFEFAIPLSALGNPSTNVKAFVMLVNDPGEFSATTLSNQFLTPAGVGEGNYGNGNVNFNLAQPNPISYALASNCTTQTCITVSPLPIANALYDNSICSGESTSINLSSTLGGTSFSWTASQSGATGALSGAGTTINQILNTSGAANGTVTYTITPASGSCVGNPINTTITINPTPTLTPIFHD